MIPKICCGIGLCGLALASDFLRWAGISSPIFSHSLDGESLSALLGGNDAGRTKRIARSELLGEKEETQFCMVRVER